MNRLAKELMLAQMTGSGKDTGLANESTKTKGEANVEDIIAGVIACRLSREAKTKRA